MILQIGEVVLTSEIITEFFCCDLEKCKGICCVEGDSGAPLLMEEVAEMENVLDDVWQDLSAKAQSVIDRRGVACTDADGDLVTNIVDGRDCVFTCYASDGCCFCAADKAFREGKTSWRKPISCALYPIREKRFKNGQVGLQYHRWTVCRDAISKGRELNLRIYEFLREPLIERFGAEWYDELCLAARHFLEAEEEHS